jgi:hypothetical protein
MPTPLEEVTELAAALKADDGWHSRLQCVCCLHPAVTDLLERGHRPTNLHALVLEWPHVALNDAKMLAFTPDAAKGERGISVKTAPGKYLRKHWPSLADNDVRDTVARVLSAGLFQWRDTSDEIVDGVQSGPSSCMKWDDYEFEYAGDEDGNDAYDKPHPYRAYDPKLGWRMAVRFHEDGKRVDGRCLVYAPEGETPVFVRSFRRCFQTNSYTGEQEETYSQSDEALESWLRNSQGCVKKHEWPKGTRLKKLAWEHPHWQYEFVVPYIDGDHHNFDVEGEFLAIAQGGEYTADNTDGSYGENENRERCDCCGEYVSGVELWAGVSEDQPIGSCCASEYVEVSGRYGWNYYMHEDNDNVIELDGDYYDKRYISENGVVQLHDDSYAKEDETWRCEATGLVYAYGAPDPIEVDGDTYHPDHAPEPEDDSDEEDEDPFTMPAGISTDVYAVGGEGNGQTAPSVPQTQSDMSPAFIAAA